MRSIVTGPDAQWAAIRRGRELSLLSYASEPPAVVAHATLDCDDVDVALVGPPTALVVLSRGERATLVLHQPPYLDAVARLELGAPMRVAAITGPRLVLVSPDGKQVSIVRIAGNALGSHAIDPGSPVELAVGLDKHQVLLALQRKLEVWDAVSGRPMLRTALQLPPPPRTVGAAAGHLWAVRGGSDEVIVYRLSDGRPFRHYVGAPVEDVAAHPASPFVVLATPRGLVRMSCFAHSLTLVDDAPWTPGTPIAQLVAGETVSLVGLPDGDAPPWRVALGGGGAVPAVEHGDAASKPSESGAVAGASARVPSLTNTPWRDLLAAYATELARGGDAELPVVAIDSELGVLAQRLALGAAARRALVALYALYLVGEPAPSLAQLARATGDWTEPLGRGELAAHAMLARRGGTVALRAAAADVLDGAAPRAARVLGDGAPILRAGEHQLFRDGRSDAAIEHELGARLGRVAVVDGRLADGVLEAYLRGITAAVLAPPRARPSPWPRGAGLVVVVAGETSGWAADLPGL